MPSWSRCPRPGPTSDPGVLPASGRATDTVTTAEYQPEDRMPEGEPWWNGGDAGTGGAGAGGCPLGVLCCLGGQPARHPCPSEPRHPARPSSVSAKHSTHTTGGRGRSESPGGRLKQSNLQDTTDWGAVSKAPGPSPCRASRRPCAGRCSRPPVSSRASFHGVWPAAHGGRPPKQPRVLPFKMGREVTLDGGKSPGY